MKLLVDPTIPILPPDETLGGREGKVADGGGKLLVEFVRSDYVVWVKNKLALELVPGGRLVVVEDTGPVDVSKCDGIGLGVIGVAMSTPLDGITNEEVTVFVTEMGEEFTNTWAPIVGRGGGKMLLPPVDTLVVGVASWTNRNVGEIDSDLERARDLVVGLLVTVVGSEGCCKLVRDSPSLKERLVDVAAATVGRHYKEGKGKGPVSETRKMDRAREEGNFVLLGAQMIKYYSSRRAAIYKLRCLLNTRY